jgi:uncharacterized membrane protein
MRNWIIGYIATAVAFLAADAVWLSLMAKRLYQPTLGDILLPSFRPAPAILFYLIYIAGICFFALAPALALGRWQVACLNGAILGFIAYATYDLTNQATIARWSTLLTASDLAWGTFVTAFGATIGYLVVNAFRG